MVRATHAERAALVVTDPIRHRLQLRDDEGERARPVLFGKFEAALAERTQFEGLLQIGTEDRERLDAGASLRDEDPVECVRIERVGGDAVERVRWDANEIAVVDGRHC